jgi:hypothetical protein
MKRDFEVCGRDGLLYIRVGAIKKRSRFDVLYLLSLCMLVKCSASQSMIPAGIFHLQVGGRQCCVLFDGRRFVVLRALGQCFANPMSSRIAYNYCSRPPSPRSNIELTRDDTRSIDPCF